MRSADILAIALSALWQQKVRTLLTIAGIVIGTFALAISVSLSRGFEEEVIRQIGRGNQLRQVLVWPDSRVKESDIPELRELDQAGPMSDAKRERLRKAILRRWNQKSNVPRKTVHLTSDRVQQLSRLKHVESVEPVIHERFQVELESRDPQERYSVRSAAVDPEEDQIRLRLVAGPGLTAGDRRSVLLGEYLLFRWHIVSEEEVQRVIGRKVRLKYRPSVRMPATQMELFGEQMFGLGEDEIRVLQKVLTRLPLVEDQLSLTDEERLALHNLSQHLTQAGGPSSGAFLAVARLQVLAASLHGGPATGPLLVEALREQASQPVFEGEFTIAGVVREPTEEDASLGTFLGMVNRNAELLVPLETAQEIYQLAPENRETGYDSVLLTVDSEDHVKEVVEEIEGMGLRQFSLTGWMQQLRKNLRLSTFVTSLLAFIALLVAGLGITNTMIMSVLERRREIGVMKAVGARDAHILLIFLVEGALIGVLGGGLGIGCAWLASFPGDGIARQLLEDQNGMKLKGTLFVFPLWLTLGVPFFAAVVTTVAALYPAWRASRVNPIEALRHE